jgi:hypothetical protein
VYTPAFRTFFEREIGRMPNSSLVALQMKLRYHMDMEMPKTEKPRAKSGVVKGPVPVKTAAAAAKSKGAAPKVARQAPVPPKAQAPAKVAVGGKPPTPPKGAPAVKVAGESRP